MGVAMSRHVPRWILLLIMAGCASWTAPGAGNEMLRETERESTGAVTLANGFTLRYRKAGSGPPLVLLHTLRTQLEYFDQVVPALTGRHTVYVVDLPGHGDSSILPVEYTEALFRESVRQFLDRLDLRGVTLAGESIGGALALTVSADVPDRVTRVVAINPYDYGERFGGGIRRGSGGWVIGFFEWFGRYTIEPKPLLAIALRGGLHDSANLSDAFLDKLHRSGARADFRRMESSLFANWESWVTARGRYASITVPVTLAYSEWDWSNLDERERDRQALHLERVITIAGAGHFASLESPQSVIDILLAGPEQ
jgi:pimeloyl-ACP methyl ester carboxylesterase